MPRLKSVTDANGTKIYPVTITRGVYDTDKNQRLNETLANKAENTVMGASGSNHAKGLVPDPGSTLGNTKYLREDGTWLIPPDSFQWYGTSSTAADVVQKEVSIPSITSLKAGQLIIVLPTVTSTVADSTLKLNSFDAYPMRYGNTAITTSTDSIVWTANYPSVFVFDGSYWIFLAHGYDSNTTYSSMSVAEGTTGTSTKARTIAAVNLKGIIDARGYTTNTGTVTSVAVKMNNVTKGTVTTSGTIDLGTVITEHQDISGKVDKTTTVNGHALSGNVSVTKSDVGLGNVTNDSQVKRSEMGVASGVATLDSAGKVPSSQLPSYVDDVLEYDTKSAFPTTGETGKIYVDKTTNKTWRWGGTDYVEISQSLALGETSSTAYAGDKGKALADKLATIETGAEVNVQSDWNATSGNAVILNKPTIPAAAANGTYTVKTLVGSTTTNISDFTANLSSADDVTFVQGSNVTITPDATNRKITISATDTTYESKSAASGGTDVSLVTTGEKYTWNGKQGTVAELGSTTKPLYTSTAGTFAECSTYAGGTSVTLNGTSKAASTASFYAPTEAGTAGQLLMSTAGAPGWRTGDIVHYATSVSGTVGTKSSNRSIWNGTVDGITELYTGLTVQIKIPVAGVNVGIVLNINGLGEHPVVHNVNSLVTTHYAVDTILTLIYDADQTASVTVSGTVTSITGCWKLSLYDTNTDVQMRLYKQITNNTTWNKDYPIIASRTLSSGIAETDGKYAAIYGLIGSSSVNPTVNPITGNVKVKSLTLNGTTLESKTASASGTDLSLVTTGEKAIWDAKQNALTFTSTPSSNNKVVTLNDVPTTLPASDVSAWAKESSKPSYDYSEIGYTVNTTTANGVYTGDITIDGSKPLHVITITGNVTVTLSLNPPAGHSTHVLFTSTAARTVTINHDSTSRVCPEAANVTLNVVANGYVEVDFLNANSKIYVRGV